MVKRENKTENVFLKTAFSELKCPDQQTKALERQQHRRRPITKSQSTKNIGKFEKVGRGNNSNIDDNNNEAKPIRQPERYESRQPA